MKRTSLLLTFLLAFLTCAWAEEAKQKKAQATWTSVGMGYSANPFVTVKRVDFHADSTVVTLHIDFQPNRTLGFSSKLYLSAGERKYPVRSSTGIKLDKHFTLPQSGKADFTLTFAPLPAVPAHFDLVEPEAYALSHIYNCEAVPTGIEDTYWRDNASGDWLIGFTKHGVIYDCKVWEIQQQIGKKGKYELTIHETASGTTKKVSVGKLKKGRRTIAVGGFPALTCSPVTTATLPHYPAKDTISAIRDNQYRTGDSITLTGWLKDMPQAAWKAGGEFKVFLNNIITDEQECFSARMDSLGRFSLKVPLLNSSQSFLDWERTNCQTYFEPGETYFLLYDFHTGQRLFMGDNCRVQNELLGHKYSWMKLDASEAVKVNKDPMAFLARTDSARKVSLQALNEELAQHPTLSTRFANYLTDWYMAQQAFTAMQGRYYFRPLPEAYMAYAGREFWDKLSRPFTLHREYSTFLRDYIQEMMMKKENENTIPQALFYMDRMGHIVLTESEKQLLHQYEKNIGPMKEKVNATKDKAEQEALIKQFNESESVAGFNRLLEKLKISWATLGSLYTLNQESQLLDSLSCPAQLRDIILTRRLLKGLEQTRQPLDSMLMAVMEKEIHLPAAKQCVERLHYKYLKLQQGDLAHAASLRPSTDVAGMTDGEQILRQLLAPYKGRIVYLDIWGTWCRPCLENISKTHRLKEALRDYDITYMYLANNSNEGTWKSVIKEYNLTGEDIVHYNLPYAQQEAVENYLKVHSYPSYRLIDKQGNIHDLHWLHMEDMDALVKRIDSLSK